MYFSFKNAEGLVKLALDNLSYFCPNGEGVTPIPAKFVSCTQPTNLVLVIGENASGKSFFRRIVSSLCKNHDPKIECIKLSMEGRGDSFGGLRSFVYGDEETEATGVNSIGTVLGAIKTSRGRTNPHMIVWDEPDLGLSEGASIGLGAVIAEYTSNLPETCNGVFLITHSKPLVAALGAAHALFLGYDDGKAPGSVSDWLHRAPVPCTPQEVKERSNTRWKLITHILNTVNKKA